MLTINQFLIYISNNNNQKQDFPRNLLHYLDPIARWSYPDYKNLVTNSKSLFIVGDSIAEGAGDLFLKNSYKYSIGHFLDEKWRKNINIYLAANVGSNIPIQLHILEKHLKGYSKNLTGLPIKSDNLNLVLYFYEGNDLDNTFLSKKVPFQSFKGKLRLKFPIVWAAKTSMYLAREKILLISKKQLPLTKQNNLRNKVCVDYLCRNIPPLQTAAAGLSEKQIIDEIKYLEDSVKQFSFNFPTVNMCLVYVPSHATIYSPKEDFYFQNDFQNFSKNKPLKTDTISNTTKSLLIRRSLNDRLDFDFMTFVDPTKTLQKRAQSEFLHGIRDYKHFNEIGYKLLADETSKGCSII